MTLLNQSNFGMWMGKTFEVLLLSVLMRPLLVEASVQDSFFEIPDVTCVSDPIKTAVQLPTNLQCAMYCLKTAGTDYNTCNGFSFDAATSSCLLCNDGANMDDRPDLEASPGSSVFARRFKTRCLSAWKFNLANGHCYLYDNETRMSWNEAENACAAYENGTHLISVGDQQEMEFLLGKHRTSPWKKANRTLLFGRSHTLSSSVRSFSSPDLTITFITGITTEGVWLGATDAKHWGKWMYTDGTQMTFTNWARGQPDSNIQHCLHFSNPYFGIGLYDDQKCNLKLPFVCEGNGY
ncbi:unnamed protein product [Cyprideis torosa]|uniref:Uncharacterized protein n=1 Tax=Cyprideis torosa TaxID=163714 RepID=A0A7R8W707_9CRUS|nr:unnamed protein product [Cyprideis torosa]CAG0882817.1 unnamed protein product [Cyprideis torosa]